MCNGHLSKEQVEKLHAICAERNNDPGELINILHAAQEPLAIASIGSSPSNPIY